MSCINSARKVFAKEEEIELEGEGQEKNEDHMKEQPLTKEMSQNISMFRKYLVTKGNIGKTNMEESHVINAKSTLGALLPAPSTVRRCPSLLEKKLFPQLSKHERLQSPINGLKSAAAQLTIFYAGGVNVFDNVPREKAEAIMVIAGEGALREPKSGDSTDNRSIPLASKMQPDVSIARKTSRAHFLEKRRNGLRNKSPYSLPRDVTEHEEPTPTTTHPSTLSPFPSRFGHFYSMKS